MEFDTNKLTSAGLAPADVDPLEVVRTYGAMQEELDNMTHAAPSADMLLQVAYLICTNRGLCKLMRSVLTAAGLDLEGLDGDG